MLLDLTIGRKGFLTYLKSLGGSNIVKIVPSNGDASESRVADKRLKVVCGANTSYLDNMAWVGEKTPLTLCDIRVSPSYSVSPNLGATELSEALSRVLPFTSNEDARPILQCVLFRVKDGKLTLVSADGYRLAVLKLDFIGDEGQVLVNRDELKGVTGALRRARRVRLALEKRGDNLDGMNLNLDTELIRYGWRGCDGNFPDWEKLIPADFTAHASFDTNEALKAVSSLKVIADAKAYAIDLIIGNGKVVMANPDDKGQAEIPADTTGEVKVRLDGGYLAEALRACGGMVELKLIDAKSPMLFTAPDYELVVMPMLTPESQKPKDEAKVEKQAEAAEVAAEPTPTEEAEKAQAVAEAEAITKADKPKPKPKHGKVKEPVAVA